VTISGANFTGTSAVSLGGVATGISVVNPTTITATTPKGTAGAASVVVTTPGGSNAANTRYTFVTLPPVVTTNSLSSGAPVLVATVSSPVPGDLDPLDLSITDSYLLATAVQPDGKTIPAGYFNSVSGVSRKNIARLNADGTVDMGFDPMADNWVPRVALQANGGGSGLFESVTTFASTVTAIETWRQTWYGTTAITGDNADPYKTGVPNFLVSPFFGPTQDPALAKINLLPKPVRSGANGKYFMRLKVTNP
jgi:hypothetical protein